MTTMEWEYHVEEISPSATEEDIQKLLSDLGDGGWELTTSLVLPGDLHINKGAGRTYLLLKKPLKRN
jgi:hypothetical protein